MSGILDKFRNDVVTSVWRNPADIPKAGQIDDKIALGVLLWVVAEADSKFLPQEQEAIERALKRYSKLDQNSLSLVLASIRQAAEQRIDLYSFTSEVTKGLPYPAKISVLEELFRIACSDKDLAESELETIRKVSGLFGIGHKDFIKAKIRVKKEFGLDTGGF